MQENIKNWYTHPTKTVLIIIISIWLLGLGLLLLALTDSFNKKLEFNREATLVFGLIGSSTAFVYETFIKYLKNKKKEKN